MEDSSRTVPGLSGSQEFFFVAVAKDEHAGNSHSLRNIFTRRGILRSPVAVAIFFGLIALFLFLAGIRNPAQPYYDEGFYIPAARAILANTPGPNNGSPPLGKLLIAEGIRLLGDNPWGWRVPGAIFGSLALVAVFLWTFLLSRDVGIAALAAGLTLFNNFLFVMSRLAMLDVFLVCFILWGLVAYTAALVLELTAAKRRILLYCAGISLGLATAVKLNGVDTLAVLILVTCALLWLSTKPATASSASLLRYGRNLRQTGVLHLALGLVAVPLISYSLTFWPLCRSLHVPFNFRQLVDMSVYLWRFKVTTEVNVAITSQWYTWPFHVSPQRGLSYLLGNPVVMWSGLASLALGLRRIWKSLALPETLVLLLYAAHWLQWAVTPVKAAFYYYYFPSAMFLGVALALALRDLPRTLFGVRPRLVVLIAAAAVFLWCVPRMAHLQAPWDCVLGCWN
jgi:dolichyl-phosphate-mannose-protein mannosyltransferase